MVLVVINLPICLFKLLNEEDKLNYSYVKARAIRPASYTVHIEPFDYACGVINKSERIVCFGIHTGPLCSVCKIRLGQMQCGSYDETRCSF
jgi:hypothetical protein